jgi:hypothetical protein
LRGAEPFGFLFTSEPDEMLIEQWAQLGLSGRELKALVRQAMESICEAVPLNASYLPYYLKVPGNLTKQKRYRRQKIFV